MYFVLEKFKKFMEMFLRFWTLEKKWLFSMGILYCRVSSVADLTPEIHQSTFTLNWQWKTSPFTLSSGNQLIAINSSFQVLWESSVQWKEPELGEIPELDFPLDNIIFTLILTRDGFQALNIQQFLLRWWVLPVVHWYLESLFFPSFSEFLHDYLYIPSKKTSFPTHYSTWRAWF